MRGNVAEKKIIKKKKSTKVKIGTGHKFILF